MPPTLITARIFAELLDSVHKEALGMFIQVVEGDWNEAALRETFKRTGDGEPELAIRYLESYKALERDGIEIQHGYSQ